MMTPPPVLLLVPFLVAFAMWGLAQGPAHRWGERVRWPAQGALALLLVRVLWANNYSAAQTGVAACVWVALTACLWWTRSSPDREPTAGLFGLQGALWLCVLAPSLPGLLIGFCAAGVCLTVFAAVGASGFERVFRLHRLADALAIAALLVWLLWSSDVTVAHIRTAQGRDDGLLSPIAGLSAATWLVGLLSAALAFRAIAAALTCARTRTRMLVTICTLIASTFGFGRMFALGKVTILLFACAAGVFSAWGLARLPAISRVSNRVYRGFRLCGLFIAGINRWVFSTVLLQAPVVAVDACARVLRLLAGGDIQRYVAIGVAGFAALVFMTTRPASPAALEIEADGLTIRAAAGRGTLSSSRLLYDYDFDGDEQLDRVGVGPHAAFVYAAPGTYSVAVTIRDPYWHTSKTLRAKVQVRR